MAFVQPSVPHKHKTHHKFSGMQHETTRRQSVRRSSATPSFNWLHQIMHAETILCYMRTNVFYFIFFILMCGAAKTEGSKRLGGIYASSSTQHTHARWKISVCCFVWQFSKNEEENKNDKFSWNVVGLVQHMLNARTKAATIVGKACVLPMWP